jgi:hypothetical protein
MNTLNQNKSDSVKADSLISDYERCPECNNSIFRIYKILDTADEVAECLECETCTTVTDLRTNMADSHQKNKFNPRYNVNRKK